MRERSRILPSVKTGIVGHVDAPEKVFQMSGGGQIWTRMADYVREIRLGSVERIALRREVVGHWLDEAAGDPNESHRYRYNVERLGDGKWVFLKRPAWLNKGMDFVIWCEGFREARRDSRPKHADVFGELEALIGANPGHRREILTGVRRVWECEPPEQVLAAMPKSGKTVRVERLLKILRWLFIEQDLTYWTGSGRWMPRGGIEETYGRLP